MGVLENFPGVVEEVAFNPDRILREAGDEKYRLFLLRLAPVVRARSNKQTHPTHRDRWQFNGVTLHVLHPAGADRLEALARGMRNGGSLIVAEYEGTRLLCALVGLDGRLVEVEVDLGPGLPAFNVVVLADGTQERVTFSEELERAVVRTMAEMRRILATGEPPGPRWVGKKVPGLRLPAGVLGR